LHPGGFEAGSIVFEAGGDPPGQFRCRLLDAEDRSELREVVLEQLEVRKPLAAVLGEQEGRYSGTLEGVAVAALLGAMIRTCGSREGVPSRMMIYEEPGI